MIHFDCECGKSLNAPENLAGTVGCCPVCRIYVAVPQPGDGSSGFENADVYAVSIEPPSENDPRDQPAFVPVSTPRAPFRRDALDAWVESLQGVKFIGGISGLLSLLTALGMELYPHVLQAGIFWMSGLFLMLVGMGVMAVVAGYGCRFVDSVLECEMRGGGKKPELPELDPGLALTSFAKWALCFVAGPAFFFYEALRFWIQCGDVSLVDGLILAELTVPALAYWLIGVFVLNNRPDLAVPSPWQVLKTIRNLGRRVVPAAFAMTAAAGIHLWLGVNALVLLHSSWLVGLVLLWICWFSVWQCGALAARTLGIWHYRARDMEAQETIVRTV